MHCNQKQTNKRQELSKTAEGRKQAWEMMQKEISDKMDAIIENAPESAKTPEALEVFAQMRKAAEKSGIGDLKYAVVEAKNDNEFLGALLDLRNYYVKNKML